MENKIKEILNKIGIKFTFFYELNNLIITRDSLLNDELYYSLKIDILDLRTVLSSSNVSVVQKNADIVQKWPLINLTRQLLNVCGYKMNPIRKSNGYDENKKKLYKRFFIIKKI